MENSNHMNQVEKAESFKLLHEAPGIFAIPNPWDAGTAKLLSQLGFKALATTSAGLAFTLGRPDGLSHITREETLQNARAIVEATQLPVAADLENGFGDSPEACAETIKLAAATGLVGGSIEDNSGNSSDPIYSFEQSVERVKAAVAAASELPFPFILAARAENLIYGRIDLNDTIRRLQAYADAGADVLFAPGLKTIKDIETVVKAVAPKPLNVVMGLSGTNFTLHQLEDAGVKRVSVGSALVRAAFGAFFNAAKEIQEKGSFSFADQAMPYPQLNSFFNKKL